MSCKELNEFLGVSITPITDDGAIYWLSTPFKFPNGQKAPIYIERLGTHIRFFDDGCIYMYFSNLGFDASNSKNFKFLKESAKSFGGVFNDQGVVELVVKKVDAATGFKKYIKLIDALCAWEEQHRTVNYSAELFVEEVVLYLTAWKGVQVVKRDKLVSGITGKNYKFPLAIEDKPILAIQPNKQQASTALHKLVDIKADPRNSEIQPMVIIDDRINAKKANEEAKILSAVSSVMMMSRVIKNAAASAELH